MTTTLRTNIFEKNKILIFCGNMVTFCFEKKKVKNNQNCRNFYNQINFKIKLSAGNCIWPPNSAGRSAQSSRMAVQNFMTSSQKLVKKS